MNDDIPTYRLLEINQAYNEGKITFREWLELSREWALKMIERHELLRTEPDPYKNPEQPPPQTH
jgi:hypothetical protein